ncbi:hypothetical protein WL68_34175 [Burkholderia cepacia]|nr:hypothetical protein WL06_20605 [Burkholderia cepacia]KWD54923.1 hypothetical protein WL68_34175 [Burkholderia cepacia]KWD87237.1 hypothetical protein WL69_07155 [Burkholderia cepacia]
MYDRAGPHVKPHANRTRTASSRVRSAAGRRGFPRHDIGLTIALRPSDDNRRSMRAASTCRAGWHVER